MTLPVSGPISFNAINVELGQAGTTTASLGQTSYRTLAGVASGAISLSNFYGKSSVSFKGILARAVTANSWFTASTTINTLIATATSTLAVNEVSGSGKTGYVVIQKSTNSYLGGYGVSFIGGSTSATAQYFNNTADKWGNYWIATNPSVTTSGRLMRISASSNYSTITHQWAYYVTNTGSGTANSIQAVNFPPNPLINDPNYTVFSGGDFGRGYYLRVDSSGNVTTFNNTPATTGSGVNSGLLNGGTSNNEYVGLCSSASSLSSWGANNLFTRMNSSLSVLSQHNQDPVASANAGKNGFFSSSYVGPITNIMMFSFSGRYGGGTSTFGRGCLAYYSMGSSGSQPTLLACTRTSTSGATDLNPNSPYRLLAVYNGYEYWGTYDYYKIYRVNSSGLIVQGWICTKALYRVVCNDYNGLITIALSDATFNPNTYQGQTTIDRLLTNQVTGWTTFSDYSNYNGQYFYNIPFGSTSLTPTMSAVSYPLTRTNYPNGPTTFSATSDQTLYSANASDMGGAIVNG